MQMPETASTRSCPPIAFLADIHRLNNQHRWGLSGTPGNSDVGVKTLQWQALDDAGSTATYRLRLDVQNVNDAPERRNNPNLSELGKIINGVPEVNQDAYGRLDLRNSSSIPTAPMATHWLLNAEISKDAQRLRPFPIGLA